jgi:uncharacterized protein (DUF2267 family)
LKEAVVMKLEDFLEMVREGLGLKNLKEADKVVRVVVGVLKANLPEDKEAIIAEALPGELSSGWEEVEPLSSDIADRAEMSLEMETPPVKPETPTITDG